MFAKSWLNGSVTLFRNKTDSENWHSIAVLHVLVAIIGVCPIHYCFEVPFLWFLKCFINHVVDFQYRQIQQLYLGKNSIQSGYFHGPFTDKLNSNILWRLDIHYPWGKFFTLSSGRAKILLGRYIFVAEKVFIKMGV